MRALGLDVGSKTIGVAVSDAGGVIASAREVLPRRGQDVDASAVVALVRSLAAACVVVGLPLELDGREGHRARRVRVFVGALERALARAGDAVADGNHAPVPIVFWDERFSTAAAERTLLSADVSRARRRQKIDAVAAQFILQGWLDARGRGRGGAGREPG